MQVRETAWVVGCVVGASVALFCSAAPVVARSDGPVGRKVGQVYPDFVLPRLDGGWGRLSDYRGKKTVLFHFASW